jgi:hypothetical protein
MEHGWENLVLSIYHYCKQQWKAQSNICITDVWLSLLNITNIQLSIHISIHGGCAGEMFEPPPSN